MLNKARIAVLVSGGGTNLEALLNAQEAGALPHGEIVLVLSSNPEAYALERAKRRGVPAIPLSRKQLGQEPFEAALMEALTQYRVDLVVLAGFLSILSADYLNVDQDNVFTTYGRVNSDGVNVRSDASTDSSVLATIEEDAIVTVNGLVDGWYDVTCEYGTEGYIRSDFLDLTESSSSNSDIAATAKQYLGTGYVYGGASPRGFDCSGFTMYVYSQHGYSLPHSATSQWQSGLGARVYSISELQPGDLVFFNDPSRNAGKACSHAGIYTGDGQFIHSSSSRSGGVIVSSLTSGYYNT